MVNAGLLHRALDEIGVAGAAMGDIGLGSKLVVHGVPNMDKLLDFLELVGNLHGLGLIEVVGIAADGIGDIAQEVKEAPTATAAVHAGIGRWVPPGHHQGDGPRLEEFHDIQRLVLDHHLVCHTCRHNDRKQGGEGHSHLDQPPERPVCARKGSVTEELVGLENDIINLLFKDVDAEVL